MNISYERDFGLNTRHQATDLTRTGERQHYLLGLKRRRKYVTNGNPNEGKFYTFNI